jgi:hypothetical protein
MASRVHTLEEARVPERAAMVFGAVRARAHRSRT